MAIYNYLIDGEPVGRVNGGNDVRSWVEIQREITGRDYDHAPEAGMSYEMAEDRALERGGVRYVTNTHIVAADAGTYNN